jgi:hypothetical protein
VRHSRQPASRHHMSVRGICIKLSLIPSHQAARADKHTSLPIKKTLQGRATPSSCLTQSLHTAHFITSPTCLSNTSGKLSNTQQLPYPILPHCSLITAAPTCTLRVCSSSGACSSPPCTPTTSCRFLRPRLPLPAAPPAAKPAAALPPVLAVSPARMRVASAPSGASSGWSAASSSSTIRSP